MCYISEYFDYPGLLLSSSTIVHCTTVHEHYRIQISIILCTFHTTCDIPLSLLYRKNIWTKLQIWLHFYCVCKFSKSEYHMYAHPLIKTTLCMCHQCTLSYYIKLVLHLYQHFHPLWLPVFKIPKDFICIIVIESLMKMMG